MHPNCDNGVEQRWGKRGLNRGKWEILKEAGFEPGTVGNFERRWPIGLHKVVLKHR